MCGRFRIARKKEIIEEAFDAEAPTDVNWVPRYNVAPGQDVIVVRGAEHGTVRRMRSMRWGLIPSWSDDASVGFKMINARSETVMKKVSFKEPLRSQRCLIPADGFYEWKREGKQKAPFCFTLADESIFAFAGIWDRWTDPQGYVIESCSILTTNANDLVRDIHDRMPVVLAPDTYGSWLDSELKQLDKLWPLLEPYPAAAMRRYRVNPRVNLVKNDDPACIEMTLPEAGFLFE